mgnify:CR=1 FL=1
MKSIDGEIKYYGSHLLHDWIGISKTIIGEIDYNIKEMNANAIIVTPLRSFNSRVPSRDSNMLIYTNAIDHPEVVFESTNFEFVKDSVHIYGDLSFNGITKSMKTSALFMQGDSIYIAGSFFIRLSDYEIIRPSFMFMKIDDSVKIEYYFNLKI